MCRSAVGLLIADAFLELAGPDDAEPTRWPVTDRTIIGRDPACDVCVAIGPISRRHCSIERRDGLFWLADLGSSNGTFLGGASVTEEPVRLGEGDEIVLAGAVTLVFRDTMATPMAPRIGKLHGLWIDPETDAVWVDARRLEPPLSTRQLDLLRLLDEADGEIVKRTTIVDVVWADVAAEGVSDEALAALIKRLKARLQEVDSPTTRLDIVRGRGVRLITT